MNLLFKMLPSMLWVREKYGPHLPSPLLGVDPCLDTNPSPKLQLQTLILVMNPGSLNLSSLLKSHTQETCSQE